MKYGDERNEVLAHDFDSFWKPSYRASDIWQVQGLLRDRKRRFVDFIFRVQVMRITSGGKSFTEVNVMLIDRMNRHTFTKRSVFPGRHVDIDRIYIDGDCILCGDLLQLMLFDGKDIAMRIRLDGLGLDLRLNRRCRECWFGENGLLPFSHLQRQYKCSLPQMAVTGRMYAGRSSIVVQGTASMQHYQGDILLNNDKQHWDRFNIFLDNGDQLDITAMPRAGYGMLEVFSPGGHQTVAEQFSLNHTAVQRSVVFTYPSEWTLHIPQYQLGEMVLRVDDFPQLFSYPIPRPLLAVGDRSGKKIGWAVAELLPGAVSSQSIDIKLLMHQK